MESMETIPKTKSVRFLWSSMEEDYEIQDIIGMGRISIVQSAIFKPQGVKCALKQISLDCCSVSFERLEKEMQLLLTFEHENIAPILYGFLSSDGIVLVMDIYESGSLFDILKYKMSVSRCFNGVFDESTIATVTREALKGLKYIHSMGIIHGNVKSSNILLCEDGAVKLCDLSSWRSSSVFKNLGQSEEDENLYYLAPEIMNENSHCCIASDIWALGITVMEMVTGFTPYHNYPPMKAIFHIFRTEAPSFATVMGDDEGQYKNYGTFLRKLVVECVQKDPNKRPNAVELLQHRFMNKAKDVKYLLQTLVTVGPTLETRLGKIKQSMSVKLKMNRFSFDGWSINDISEFESEVKFAPVTIYLNQPSRTPAAETDKQDQQIGKPPPGSIVHFNLKLRNQRDELNEIRFHMEVGADSPEIVSHELVASGLIATKDCELVAHSITSILHKPNLRTLIFHLESTGPNDIYDEKLLRGFAQLTILIETTDF